MSGLLPLIIQLVSGAVGGNVAGSLFKNLSLGTLWNSVAGIAGGGLGGTILSMLGMGVDQSVGCLLYTSPSPRDQRGSRMPSSA